MKITCPECASSFDVPVSLMGAGRRVKCGNCGHIWMQTPVSENTFSSFRSMEGDSGMDPIPASVHPTAADNDDEDDNGPGFMSGINWGQLGRMVGGFILGWAALGGLMVALAMGHMLPRAFMPMAVAMGAPHPADMKGVAIEDVRAHVEKDTTIVDGSIVNNGAYTHDLPMVEILPVASDGTLGEGKRIKPEQDIIKAGETVKFTATLQGAFDQDTLRLRLIP